MNDLAFQRPGPMPFRLLLDEALRQARRHFRVLYAPVAIPLTVITTLLAVVQALWVSRASANPARVGSPFGSPDVLLLAFATLGALIVAVMALQVGAMDSLMGRPVDMKRAWRFAVRGRVLGTLVLCFLASLASVFCCCFPALFVIPLLSFVSPVMIEEERFGFNGISRSAELALYDPGQGFFERPLVKMLLFMFVSLLISYLLGLLVALPFQLPMWIDMFRGLAKGEDISQAVPRWVWLQVPGQFLNTLVSTAVYVYTSFGIGLLYFDTRGRREGTDLRSEIDVVFGAPPPELPL
jgi:hypothetical protein